MPLHHASDHDEPEPLEPMDEFEEPECLVVAAHIFITCTVLALVAVWLMLQGS